MNQRKTNNIFRKTLLLVLALMGFTCLFSNKTQANHLVGGELTYECLGGNQYRINLLIYRDCYSTGAPFDNPAAIYLRDAAGVYQTYPDPAHNCIAQGVGADEVFRIPIYLNTATDTLRIPVNDDDICADDVPDVCVSRAIYSTVLELDPKPGGYEVVYQRCCRNTTILNINLPGETGSTYSINIPHEDNSCDNSSPVFNNFPPLVICDGFPILFDHSATDSDGDSLAYELCHPFDGAQPQCPGSPNPFGDLLNYIAPCFCPIGGNNNNCDGGCAGIFTVPNPIGFVNWLNGYDTNNPLGNAGDPLAIDSETGLLTGTPSGEGQYVVGICVSEYRNGVLLSTNKRDFQFNVTSCDIIRALPDANAMEIQPGVFQIINCNQYVVTFDNQSVGATSFNWDFGVEGINSDISTEMNPTYTFPDTGVYEIQLIASNGTACVDTATLLLSLYPTFTTDFDFATDLCEGEAFSFQDMTQTTFGFVDSYQWFFGDGTGVGPGTGSIIGGGPINTDGTFAAPNHIYEEAGTYAVNLFTTNNLGCSGAQTYNVVVQPTPDAEIDYDFLCLDLPTEFTGSAEGDGSNIISWNWEFDTGTATGQNADQLYDTPGDYSANLFVENNFGCRDTVAFDFTIYPQTFADAGLDTNMCLLTSVQLDASATTGGAGATGNSYLWEPSEFVVDDPTSISPSVSPTADQEFTVYVSDPNGCTDSADVFVTVFPLPAIDAGPDVILCFEDSSQQFNATIPADVVDFYWTPNIHLSADDVSDPFYYPSDTTTYFLNAIDNNACEKQDTVNVFVIPPVNLVVTTPNVTICEGDEVELIASGGMVYEWSPAGSLDDPSLPNPTATPTEDVTYMVIVSNPPCFEDSTTIDVTVNPAPFVEAGPDVTINVGENTQFNGMGEITYEWTPPESLDDPTIADPLGQPLVTTTFTLTTESDLGCKASDSLLVTVTNNFLVIIPTAFSPNGDGLNDGIGLRALGIETLNEFAIFNRWGEKVFSTSNLDDRWDGTYKGKEQELGVYVYYVNANKYLGGAFEIKGNITLIR